MDVLAQKLMRLNKPIDATSLQPTAIFGSAAQLAKFLDIDVRYRIGLWPCISQAEPELAMGLFTVLAYLLEQWRNVRVYRVFARLDEPVETYQWSLSRSQFKVEDWEIEHLDDNVGIWGTLQLQNGEWLLEIEVENDAAEDASMIVMQYTADTPLGFISLLPKIADDIAMKLGLSEKFAAIAPYPANSPQDDRFLKKLFQWEIQLLLHLFGQEWNQPHLFEDLLAAGKKAGELGAWGVTNALARALMPGYELDELVSEIEGTIEMFNETPLTAVVLSRALFNAGYTDEAFDVLETNTENHENSVLAWQALADLYIQARQLASAAETYQAAIESGITAASLYLRYAELLATLAYEGWVLADFAFIDPNEQAENQLVWEAVEACERALKQDLHNVEAVHFQIMLFLDNNLQDKRVWSRFDQLVQLDKVGDKVRSVVDSLYIFEDMSPAITALKKASEQFSDRVDLLINLAAAYVANEEEDRAASTLERARTLTANADLLADIERLTLLADDPDFEGRLGEITDIVSAGNAPSTEDVEYLEDSVQKAPTFAEGYLLLAKAYRLWDELGTALDTLLDAHKYLPDDLDVIQMLSELLWESGERKLALDYLNKGLAKKPNHVPFLALMGLHLFEEGDDATAKAYLLKGELIEPRNPVLSRVRVAVAKILRDLED